MNVTNVINLINIRFFEEIMDPEIETLIYSILNNVIKNRVVIAKRDPALHKLSVRAYYPVPVEDTAFHLSPMVCSGHNADFDGDQMGIFLPLTEEAQKEADAFAPVLHKGVEFVYVHGQPAADDEDEHIMQHPVIQPVKQEGLEIWIFHSVDHDVEGCIEAWKIVKGNLQHKQYGKIFTPVFEVVEWVGMTGENAEAEAEPEGEAPVAEAPARRRRVG